MKPASLLSAAILVPLSALIARADFPEFAPSHDQLLAVLPSPSDRVWVKVRQSVSVDDLARELQLPETKLASINDVSEDHRFTAGDWVVLPSQSSRDAKWLSALDTTELRRTPPLQLPPPAEETALVRVGDTVGRIAQRYGLALQDLMRLNPGLETARLVVGSQVRLAQAGEGRSRMVLGLAPVGSGGLSWPQLPEFGPDRQEGPFRFNPDQAWSWPTQGVFTSGYGWRWGRMHKGIDVANNVGTPIRAARDGRVIFSGWNDGGYGYLVELQHGDGSISRYAHNSRLLVSVGQDVAQGTTISLMGSTGRSTGPHLHFEIHRPGQGALNPLNLLPTRA